MCQPPPFPKLILARQLMPRGTAVAIEARLSSALQSINFDRLDLSGQTIGLTVGSRGISHLADIVRHLSARIRDRGARTVIIPAMGSHGGGRLSGQRDVLAEMGVTETSCGASIIDGTSTVVSGRDAHGEPVYTISGALQCDGVVVLNRIKAHTDFEGGIESGILKMLAVGLGGPAGAAAVHKRGTCQGLERAIRDTAGVILERLNIVFAVGVIENGLGETVRVEAMGPSEIEQREPALLIEAKALSPRLPFDRLDVLLIDEIGKNISGTGMDTKVVGRIRISGQKEPSSPKIDCIGVFNLNSASRGNAIGMGLADLTTRRAFEAVDLKATAFNCLSSMTPEQGRIPCVLETEKDVVQWALTLGAPAPETARLVLIRNTGRLEFMAVSEALVPEIRQHSRLEIIEPLEEMRFSGGRLMNFKETLSG